MAINFTRLFHGNDFRYWLAEQRAIVGKVFWFLEKHADWRYGQVSVSQEQIAEHFSTTTRNIRLALKTLKDSDIIRGSGALYALNPNVVWSGYDKDVKRSAYMRMGKTGRMRFNPASENKLDVKVGVEILDGVTKPFR